jgi:hypothetical protein
LHEYRTVFLHMATKLMKVRRKRRRQLQYLTEDRRGNGEVRPREKADLTTETHGLFDRIGIGESRIVACDWWAKFGKVAAESEVS